MRKFILCLERGSLGPLEAHCDTHATTDTQRGQAAFGLASLHFKQQSVQDPAAGGADGVTDGNRAAVDVHNSWIPAHVFIHRTGLSGEGFIGFDQVQIADRPTCFV